MSDARTMEEVWQRARAEANVVVELPAGVELFLRWVAPTGPGGFRMGARGRDPDEEPIHHVVIKEGFYLGTLVVTNEQWAVVWPEIDLERWYPAGADWTRPSPARSFVREDPKAYAPVVNKSWCDAMAFCDWLTREGVFLPEESPASGDWQFCLPTEAEWEYACRGGLEGIGRDAEYWNGEGEAALREVGWFDGNSGYRTHAVTEPVIPGEPESHPLGVFGMHGNVREWCHDEWDTRAYRDCVDGDADSAATHRADVVRALREAGPAAVSALVPWHRFRVIRGGAWDDTAGGCRSAYRHRFGTNERVNDLGFRVCLVRGPCRGSTLLGGASERGEA